MQDEKLAFIAGELNSVPATAERTARLKRIVLETNELISAAADELVTIDSTPLSFQTLKADCEPDA